MSSLSDRPPGASDTDLISGEAVAVDLPVARLASRGLAFALDLLLQAVAIFFLFTVVDAAAHDNEGLLTVLVLVCTVAVLVGYPVTSETLSRGRTLGKLAIGLRVVRDDGGPIRFRHALVRGLVGFFVDFWALGLGGVVAVVSSLSSARAKRIGDLLAGTVVIRERVTARYVPQVQVPAPLVGWAAGIDTTGLPDHLALGARQLLGRWQELNPAVRDGVAQRLAADVVTATGVVPPPGTPAWAYLAAMLAERRNREIAAAWPAPRHPVPHQPTEPRLQWMGDAPDHPAARSEPTPRAPATTPREPSADSPFAPPS